MTDVLRRISFSFIVFLSRTLFISALDMCDPDVPSRPTPRVWISLPIFKNCEAGTYKEMGSGRCQKCPADHFMTKQMAESSEYSFCEKCLTANSLEIVAEPCNTTRDSLIHCKEGYYRRRAADNKKKCGCCWECARCDVCGVGINLNLNYLMAECKTDSNTLCCHAENMVVVNGSCVPSAAVEKLTNNVHETSRDSDAMKLDTNNSVARLKDAVVLCVCLMFISNTFI